MIINYRGKNIAVNDQYLVDFKRYNGWDLCQNDIDTYIYNKYIADKSQEYRIPEVAGQLGITDIENIIEHSLIAIMKIFTRNKSYGAEL